MYRLFGILLVCRIFLFSPELFSQKINGNVLDSLQEQESGIDVKIFRGINNYRTSFLESVIPITDKSVLPAALILPLGLGGIARYNNNYYDENSAVLLALSEITSTALTSGIKYIVRRERPYATLKNVHVRKDNSPTDRYSFPSGHTAMAFSMATSLTLRYPDKPAVIAGSFLYAAIAGYGRVFLGVHYPSDVLGGMLVGSGSAAVIYAFRKDIIEFKNKLFNEEGRPDSNSSLSAGAILGLTAGADALNMLVGKIAGSNVNVYSDGYSLNAIVHF